MPDLEIVSQQYAIAWDNDQKTCILTTFEPPLTWAAIQTAHVEIYRLMRSMPHRVDWINDISRSPEIPREHMFQNLRYLHARVPPNAGANIVVNSTLGAFSRTVLGVFVNSMGWMHGFAIVGSLDEAREAAARLRGEPTTITTV